MYMLVQTYNCNVQHTSFNSNISPYTVSQFKVLVYSKQTTNLNNTMYYIQRYGVSNVHLSFGT